MIIAPTIGRRVWFWPNGASDIPTISAQPCDAGIAYVWHDRLVNLTVAGHDGSMHARTSVPLLQHDDPVPPLGPYATWMPYQKGRAQRQDRELDGLPRSDRAEPSDPGVAVYWRAGRGQNRVMAIDAYDRVADNLGAVAATLEAMRAIERHGGALVLERAFTGFTALPSPTAHREWWEVLGVERTATREQVKDAHRRLASVHHPDRGGSTEAMAAINVALEQGLAACGA